MNTLLILNLLFQFTVGEKLVYHVYYGFVGAGIAYVEIPEITEHREIPCYRVVARGHTNRFFSLIYKVDDRVESYIDTISFRTIRYEKHLREGTDKRDEYSEFYPDSGYVVYSRGDTVSLADSALDVAGILFLIRRIDFSVGDTIPVNLHVDRRNCKLKILVEKEEKVKTGVGKKDAYLLRLITDKGECGGKSGLETIFGAKGGLEVWISKDEERLILKISARVFFGSIRAILQEVRR